MSRHVAAILPVTLPITIIGVISPDTLPNEIGGGPTLLTTVQDLARPMMATEGLTLIAAGPTLHPDPLTVGHQLACVTGPTLRTTPKMTIITEETGPTLGTAPWMTTIIGEAAVVLSPGGRGGPWDTTPGAIHQMTITTAMAVSVLPLGVFHQGHGGGHGGATRRVCHLSQGEVRKATRRPSACGEAILAVRVYPLAIGGRPPILVAFRLDRERAAPGTLPEGGMIFVPAVTLGAISFEATPGVAAEACLPHLYQGLPHRDRHHHFHLEELENLLLCPRLAGDSNSGFRHKDLALTQVYVGWLKSMILSTLFVYDIINLVCEKLSLLLAGWITEDMNLADACFTCKHCMRVMYT